MSDVKLDAARVKSMSRAEREIEAAKRLEHAAKQARAKADKLAEVWRFYVNGDEIGDVQCEHLCGGCFQCLRPAGHAGDHL